MEESWIGYLGLLCLTLYILGGVPFSIGVSATDEKYTGVKIWQYHSLTKMPRSSPKAKRARYTTHRPNVNKKSSHTGSQSGSMVVFTPARTRRGKISYKEVDASCIYQSSDEERETPRKKIPKTTSVSQGMTSALEDGDVPESRDFWEVDDPETLRSKKVSTY